MLAFERLGEKLSMRISFCDTPAHHREFMEKLRKMSDVIDVKVL